MKKKHLQLVYMVVRGTEGVLPLSEARICNEFMKRLHPITENYEKELKEIYEKHCTKNEDGTPNTSDAQYKFAKEVQDDLTKDIAALNEQDVELTINPLLRAILHKTEYKPKKGEIEIIDELITMA